MQRCPRGALEWVAALEVVDDDRTRRYVAALDARMERLLAAESLSDWYRALDIREVTAFAGYAAFFHAFPRSRFHGDRRLLVAFREIIDELRERQRETGELVWGGGPVEYPPHPHASHGQSWWIEPLLLGMTWVGHEFKDEERAAIDAALYRAADFIAARPIPEVNNRGVIVCAVLALCGRYFGEARFLDIAIEWFHGEPVKVMDPRSGQILEGSGPDGNYSGTTYEYLYLYRIMSGDTGIDGAMVDALKWYARVMDPNGHQTFCGAATRQPVTGSAGKVHDILPALERFSAEEPFFQCMVEQYLPLLGDGLGGMGHSISPTLWAMLEHRSVAPPEKPPAWYADMRSWYWEDPELGPQHFGYNEGYESLYFPVRQAYTSCVALRGRAPFKDLQCFTYADEPPVVYPTATAASRTRAWGIDTAVQGVSGVKLPNFCWVQGDSDGLIAQWGRLWRYCIFGPRTLFVVTDGEIGPFEADWVVDPRICGTPEVGDGVLRYEGRKGRLCFGGGAPERLDRGGAFVYRFRFDSTPSWFALTDDTFRIAHAESGAMAFRDGAGETTVEYRFIPGDSDERERMPCFAWTMFDHLNVRRQ